MALRLIAALWYFLFWLVASIQWIPNYIKEFIAEDLLASAIAVGLSITLLFPIAFILQKK